MNINNLLLSNSPSPACGRLLLHLPRHPRSLIFLHLSLDSCQLATECQCHHPLISWVSIVACMEAVKFSSTWTLSFSVHSLYWVVEGRVAKGAEVERREGGGTVGNIEPSSGLKCRLQRLLQ